MAVSSASRAISAVAELLFILVTIQQIAFNRRNIAYIGDYCCSNKPGLCSFHYDDAAAATADDADDDDITST